MTGTSLAKRSRIARLVRFRFLRGCGILLGLAACHRFITLAQLGILLRLLEAVPFGTLLIVVRLERHYPLVLRATELPLPQLRQPRIPCRAASRLSVKTRSCPSAACFTR